MTKDEIKRSKAIAMFENWLPIIGYEGRYEVSNKGRVKTLLKNNSKTEILKPSNHIQGYLRVGLRKDGISKIISIHRLVASAFIPNPEDKPQVNHIDGIKSNNKIENLEWCTQKENAAHAVLNGIYNSAKGENAGHSKLKDSDIYKVYELLKENKKPYQIAKIIGISKSTINLIVHNKIWTHLDIKWNDVYEVKNIENQVPYIKGLKRNCNHCGIEYNAIQENLRRGKGLFCNKSCAASSAGKVRWASRKIALNSCI